MGQHNCKLRDSIEIDSYLSQKYGKDFIKIGKFNSQFQKEVEEIYNYQKLKITGVNPLILDGKLKKLKDEIYLQVLDKLLEYNMEKLFIQIAYELEHYKKGEVNHFICGSVLKNNLLNNVFEGTGTMTIKQLLVGGYICNFLNSASYMEQDAFIKNFSSRCKNKYKYFFTEKSLFYGCYINSDFILKNTYSDYGTRYLFIYLRKVDEDDNKESTFVLNESIKLRPFNYSNKMNILPLSILEKLK